ncbi:unnamed protein product [Urochloa humidicola]
MANNVPDIIVLSDDDEPKGPVPDDIIVVPDSDDDDPEGQGPDIDDDNPEGQGPDIDDDDNPEGQGPDIDDDDNPEGQDVDSDDNNPEQDVASDDNNPEAQGPDSDNGNDNKRRRRGGIYKMWLFCDELLIMTTLATERHRSGRELSNADLYRAVRGTLYRKTASKAAVASKVHGLKTKFRKAFARGGPSNKDRNQRLFDLSMVAWPELMQE